MRIAVFCVLVFAMACGASTAENNCLVDGGGTGGTMHTGAETGGNSASGSGGRLAGREPVAGMVAGTSGRGGAGTGGMGVAGIGGSGGGPAPTGQCADATLLWFDDFETGNYDRWTSKTYNDEWGNDCQSTALSTESANSATHSERSEITCAYTEEDDVQRGYGGLQFAGDSVVPAYTNRGEGIDAPNGIVNTHWINLDTDTVFENGKWMSLWTSQHDCAWSGDVLTLGLEDSSGRVAAAHHDTREYEPGAAALPRHKWVRLTEYVNYYDGDLYVWQDGKLIQHATFDRPVNTICHFHWGLYASGENDDIVLYEDDNSLWKLTKPWTDFAVEPYFDVQKCK